MLFNSLQFLVFFPAVVLLYWILPDRWRNPMLLVASYYFYMSWEPVYALLILISSVTTWGCGMLMFRDHDRRKLWLVLCFVLNLGILFTYKYLGFAAQSLHDAMAAAGIAMHVPEFTLLLPVGISFYTFQAVGYTIDVYRGDLKPERSLLTYCLFVAFFPQLVAGPIERAKNLLPQFHDVHRFNGYNLLEGIKMMVWGFFMKLCIAESVAPYVNAVYNNIEMHNGVSIWLATFFFTFQIFCDFGGYSLIAIGTARCVGFTLMQNFRQPYLARDVKDFWRRWHISLSSWFSDYVYIPLGGSRCSTTRHQRNLFVTFLVSGLWHGANWTFVAWGAYHGALQVALSLKRKFIPWKFPLQRVGVVIGVIVTFVLSMFGWVLFRANSLADAKIAFSRMLHPHGMLFNGDGKPDIALPLLLIMLLMLHELRNECGTRRMAFTSHPNVYVSAWWTAVLIVIILLCAKFQGGQFIYFQF
ncbi:MAG: MBOAT family protein [Lachnospiraceae bacterium]|nr:MBOAT family protein [Lachnospiraceae bacterium]